MPPHLKRSINQARLENGLCEQIVSHLEKELELNDLEAPDQLHGKTLTQQATQQNPGKPKSFCHFCRKPDHCRNQSRQLKRKNYPAQNNTNSSDKNNRNKNGQTNSNSNKKRPKNTNADNTNNQKHRKPRPVFHPVRPVVKLIIPPKSFNFKASSANRQPPRNRRPEGQNQVQQRNARSNSDANVQAAAQTLN